MLVGVAILCVAAAAARASLSQRPPALHRGSLLAFVRRVHPLPVRLGCSMAFEPRVGRRSTGSRAALVGSVAALAGVAGAVTLTRGIADAADHPERAGVVWDAEASSLVGDSAELAPSDQLIAAVAAQPGVTAAVPVLRFPSDIDGLAVPTHGLRRSDHPRRSDRADGRRRTAAHR